MSDTTNATTSSTSRGVELEFAIAPIDDLMLSLNYTRTDIDALDAPNPFVAGNPLARVLPLYAPKNAGSVAIDYLVPIGATRLKFHLGGNWSDGFYTSELEQLLTESSFIVNSRLSLAEVQMGRTGAAAEFSLWARNLLDEKHLFYNSRNAILDDVGIFNEPRTYGVEARFRF